MTVLDVTAGRDNGRRRPKGYADYRPQAKAQALLAQVDEILAEYEDHLPLTVRQIFYRLVAAFGYEKTENAYASLGDLLGRARRARMLPFAAIRDDGLVTASADYHHGPEAFWDHVAGEIRVYRRDRQVGQRVRVELWCEAAGMLAQLARVADDYSVPVFSCSGFSSLTAVRHVADRAVRRDVPTVLLHVGDLDPSGESIFRSMVEDVSLFVAADRVIATQRIEAERLALTREHVARYELPTAPAKRSDSRTANWDGETCQLEALPPDVLAAEVRAGIEQWIDLERHAEQVEAERADRAELILGLPAGSPPEAP